VENTILTETVISHLIRPEDLQHHGTLFAGRVAEWFVEACFIAACRLVGKSKDIVCVKIHGMDFRKPAANGDILEIKSKVAFLSRTSIIIHGKGCINQDKVPAVSGMITFVTVDKATRPYAHGLVLPEEYISENRDIYEEAIKVRKAR
jgi:acyl-CoA hydrolase